MSEFIRKLRPLLNVDGLSPSELREIYEERFVAQIPQYEKFDHFARDLFLCSLHSKMILTDCEISFEPVPFVESASFVLALFTEAHGEHFHPIFMKIEKEAMQTHEQLLKFAIPRCLNLIDDDRHFYSIMLVASFLQELVLFLRTTRVCFRFFPTVYKCIVAVFERTTLKNSLGSNRALYDFGKYLKHFPFSCMSTKNKRILSELNDGNASHCKKVVDLIKNCENISDDFALNEYEKSLLIDNDVKTVEESFVYCDDDKDPLILSWCPKDDAYYEQLYSLKEATLAESQSSIDSDDSMDIADSLQPPSDPKNGKAIKSSPSSDHNTEIAIKDSPAPSSDHNTEMAVEGSSAPSSSRDCKKDADNFDDQQPLKERCKPTILAKDRSLLASDEFWEQIKLRTCACCGIKCYQFAQKLFSKQLESALIYDFMYDVDDSDEIES